MSVTYYVLINNFVFFSITYQVHINIKNPQIIMIADCLVSAEGTVSCHNHGATTIDQSVIQPLVKEALDQVHHY